MLYDTHCHPYLAKNKSKKDILENFQNYGGFLNSIGVDIPSSLSSIDLAKKHDFIFASIGVHPCDTAHYSDLENTILELEKIYLENKDYVVAIGETGLDYFHNDSPELRTTQAVYFKAQIELASKYNLPVIIHNRNSRDDVLEILKETGFKNFIFHCYSEDLDYARKLIDLAPDCKLSFSGIVTFKNATDIADTAKNIALRNIIIETDSPYLTPEPQRGRQENEPAFVKHILDKIISLRPEDPELIKKQIFKNSIEIFGIKKDES